MISEIDFSIKELSSMKKYPQELFFIGNTSLLQRKKVSIVGSRKPNQYARNMTRELAEKLSSCGVCIVSGGAIGVDAIAHKSAGAQNTIMVAATGLNKHYPVINSSLIQEIETKGLVLSQFKAGTPSKKYNFVLRNELVVALGDILIVTYADLNSGTMRSVEYALKMNKEVYVLSHRITESKATNRLLQESKAKAIYDIDDFLKEKGFVSASSNSDNPFLNYCNSNPTYEEALAQYPSEIFEAELNGDIIVRDAKVFLS